MKSRQKISYLALILCVICLVTLLIIHSRQECCLCTATAHSLCLVDLESGKILDLTLDGPTDTYVNGFEAAPSNVDTISLIHFGSVTGSRCTSPACIELKIPDAGTANTPALCQSCKKLLPQRYTGRYILVDFSCIDYTHLFPVAGDTELSVSGYQVTITTISDTCSIAFRITATVQ